MSKLIGTPPILVAHRGFSGQYPENTLVSYKAARKVGARFMELDLQLTRDRVPMLHHDDSLLRMAGVDLDIRDVRAKQVKALRASYAKRFGEQFVDNRFTTFKKFCKWLKRHSEVTVFVEIKQQSIERFGIPVFVDQVIKRIVQSDVESQCVLISFNHEVLEYARTISPKHTGSPMLTGWVLPEWNNEQKALLEKLNPEFLFCDKDILPCNDEQIWRGSWQWAIYNLDDVASAIVMANRGMPFLETNQIGMLMAESVFANRASNETPSNQD